MNLDNITPAQARALLAQIDVAAIREHGFSEFVKRGWHVFETARKLEWNWHLDESCIHAEACMPPWRADGSKPWEPNVNKADWASPLITDLAVNQPPGTTKSAIWTVMWNAWVWTWRPEARFICVAFAPALINDLSEKTYKLVTSPWYTERWPGVMPPGRQGHTEFSTAHGGWRYSTSIGGPITGKHADACIVDDPVKPSDADANSADTGAMVKKATTWLGSSMASRSFDKAKFVNVLVMQRITEYDPCADMLKREGVVHLNIPALFNPRTAFVTPFGRDPRTEIDEPMGTATNLTRANFDAMARRMGGWDSPAAQAQLQQNPHPPGGRVFKAANWIRCESIAYPLTKTFNIITVDANFKNAEDASDIAVCRIGALLPKVRIYSARSERGGIIEAIQMIKEEIKEGGRPSAILIEDKANGSGIIQLLKLKLGNVIGVIPTESKDARAHAVNVYYEGKAIEHCNDMRGMGAATLEHMLEAYPGGLKRDVVDAISQGVMYLVSKDQEAWKRAVNIWDANDRHTMGAGLDFDDLFSIT